ncbi:unnamed protein product [marine sediment metagenome]|uniref:Uncharacterized protein n=1 Tax=marine sediment metagenome TaxID=412755 RepID=X0ZHW2_9ZZZZ
MSYTKFERGKYIRLKMIHLLLLDLVSSEEFGIVWNLMDNLETAGTTHCQELAKNKYYIKAVAEWVKARQAQRQRFSESKSM